MIPNYMQQYNHIIILLQTIFLDGVWCFSFKFNKFIQFTNTILINSILDKMNTSHQLNSNDFYKTITNHTISMRLTI